MRFSFLFRCFITLLFIGISTFSMLSFASKKISSYCYEIGLRECNKYITKFIGNILDKSIDEEEFNSSFITDESDSYKEFNVFYLRAILKDIIECITKSLENDKNSYIISEIPFSLIYENPLIASLTPNVPIKYKFTSNVIVDMKSNVVPFGYNNALIEILLDFEFDVFLYIPLKAINEKIKIDIPIYSMIIEGDVPSFAYGEHNIF